jgi:peptidoglycan hydrolase-like protein with peptidoglycan-binding domain
MGAVALAAAPVLFASADHASVGAHLQMRPAAPLGFPLLQSKSQPSKSTQGSSSAKSKSTSKAPAKKRAVSRRPRGQQAPSADRIKEIQMALAREGHYQGEPTGKWDPATVQAMKSYQTASGLTASGKLDAKTLQKLGLGSDTAGQASPRTPASPERAGEGPHN